MAKPVYPEYCRAHGIEGVVALLIEVLPSGRAGAVIVKSSSGSWRLDRAAEKFSLDVARYSPARRFGRPVRSSLTLNVRFELTDEERGGLEPGPGP